MGDKGKRDKGKREEQKKGKQTLKEKRKQKKDKTRRAIDARGGESCSGPEGFICQCQLGFGLSRSGSGPCSWSLVLYPEHAPCCYG